MHSLDQPLELHVPGGRRRPWCCPISQTTMRRRRPPGSRAEEDPKPSRSSGRRSGRTWSSTMARAAFTGGTTAPIKALFMSWYARKILGKPCAYLNGGLHLTHVEPFLPPMARRTLLELDAVTIRESWSLKCAQEFVPGLEAELLPDSVFYYSCALRLGAKTRGAGAGKLLLRRRRTDAAFSGAWERRSSLPSHPGPAAEGIEGE